MLRILGEVKSTMQARKVILVTALVMIADLAAAALAMTTTMGLAMAVMMAVLPAVPVATVRPGERTSESRCGYYSGYTEAGQKMAASAQVVLAGCRQKLLEKAVGARRKKVHAAAHFMHDFN